MSTSDRDFELERLQRENAAPTRSEHDASGKRKNQAQHIVESARTDVTLSRTRAGEAFATFALNGHRETWPVRARSFALYLRRTYYTATGKAPSARAIADARELFEAEALFENGAERDVFIRFASADEAVYLDLADDGWRVVEVTRDGWRVLDESPVLFAGRAACSPSHPRGAAAAWKRCGGS